VPSESLSRNYFINTIFGCRLISSLACSCRRSLLSQVNIRTTRRIDRGMPYQPAPPRCHATQARGLDFRSCMPSGSTWNAPPAASAGSMRLAAIFPWESSKPRPSGSWNAPPARIAASSRKSCGGFETVVMPPMRKRPPGIGGCRSIYRKNFP